MNRAPPARNAQEIHRWDAAVAIDAAGRGVAPASLLVEFRPGAMPCLLALGTPDHVRAHEAGRSVIAHDLPGHLLIPGLVNAHTHLDLTHIGPQPHDTAEGFLPWVDMVRRGRRTEDAPIAASVREGIALSLRGGSVAIGDIAGSPRGAMTLTPWRELAGEGAAREGSGGVLGVSYFEFFGIGRIQPKARAEVETLLSGEAWLDATLRGRGLGTLPGLQPHAPYSVDRHLYGWIAQIARGRGIPVATHLAETVDERRFVRDGDGPNLDFLRSLGIWDMSVGEEIGKGASPVRHLRASLEAVPFLAAHVHDVDDGDLEVLARSGTSVAYCPRAGEYFAAAAHFGPHRYRDMLRAGINVCLGTDSVINLPPEQVAASGMSILDEMRLLHRRDCADPLLLLAMGTTSGARALQLDEAWFRWSDGAPLAGAVAVEVGRAQTPVEAWRAVLQSKAPPRLLFHSNLSCGTVHADA